MLDLWWLIACLVVMIIASVIDIRTKRIPVCLIVLLMIVAVSYIFCVNPSNLVDILLSLAPGALFVALSIITNDKIGMGDSIVICILGIGLGVEKCMVSLMSALFLCCIVSIGLMIAKLVKKDTQIPFIPFLTAGIGVMACIYR